MDGLEATEINFASLDLGDRFDAEYVSKENLKIESRLKEKNARKFSLYGDFIVSAFYPAATHLYASGDVPFIRCVDCVNYPVISKMQDDKFERIPSSFVLEHGTIDTLSKDEIVITKVGTPCYASIIYEHDEVALSRTVLGVKNIRGINPYYLMVFLRSRYGFLQLLRQRELTIQYQLTLHRVKAVDIFEPSIAFQSHIESLAKKSYRQLKQGDSLYIDAESLLLEELGLKDWQPPNDLTYKYTAKVALAANRLDSEFFHPKYSWLENTLANKFTIESVGTWGKVLKGMSVEYTEGEEGVPVIRSGDLIDVEAESKFLRASANQKMFYLKRGDVLISSIGFGSIGKVQVFDKTSEFATVSEVTVIRQSRVNPYYLHFFLRCPAGQMQMNRYITGATGQLHLYPKDVAKIFVPIVSTELEAKLENLFKESRELKKRAGSILRLAKRSVEIAIEQDEAAALAWMDEQTRLMDLS